MLDRPFDNQPIIHIVLTYWNLVTMLESEIENIFKRFFTYAIFTYTYDNENKKKHYTYNIIDTHSALSIARKWPLSKYL